MEYKSRQAKKWPWVMLFARLGLFIGFQALLAGLFWLAGSGESWKQAWEQGANWWMLVVTLTNLVCVFLLVRLFAANGENYWNIFRIERQNVGKDLLVMLGVLVVTGPVAFLPNTLLGGWLFGDAQQTLDLILRPLPYWGVYLGAISFSVTQGLAELPTYFSYVMPQFKRQSMATWLAIALPVLMLGLQHIGIPLLFDARFITWRAMMFLPFALEVGLVMHWRPRLLPYLAILHVVLDSIFGLMFLGKAY